MTSWYPLLAVLAASLVCAYLRTGLRSWTIAGFAALFLAGWLAGSHWLAIAITAAVFALITVPLNLPDFRRRKITAPLLKIYQKITPQLSDTERVALEAGTVGFEGELFSGKPDWKQLLHQPMPQLSIEEQAFLDGPCEELCHMINDWEITHERADLPPEIWEFLKKNKFFGMIIPKRIRRPAIFRAGALGRAAEDREHLGDRRPRPSACRTRSARPSCCCTTAPRNRRTTTCRASPMAARFRASR